ncbi:MAG: restriction endonuclease [Candidatus Omnitrophota bacterium]|nr:restriction endonuclease [Candidatus Omnitrophota bacterium]
MNDKDTQNLLENLYKNLSPKGFEFLIKVLLEKLGFDEIEVTGQSGDGGIRGRQVAGK